MKKLTFIFLCSLTSTFVQAQNQENILLIPITIQSSNQTIEQILRKISSAYDIHFSYNPEFIPIRQKVRLQLKQTPLEKALDSLFYGIPVRYEVLNRYLILSEESTNGKDKLESTLLTGRILSRSDSLPLPLVHVYFEKNLIGVVSDYEGYFKLDFRDYTLQDTLTFSMVGYQRHQSTIQNLLDQENLQLYLADSIYTLQNIDIEPKKRKIKTFFKDLKLVSKVKLLYKSMKVKVNKLLSKANIQNAKDKLSLRRRLQELIAELQELLQDLKFEQDDKKIQKIMQQIQEAYAGV
ncbi:MAG: STN and carboxypeptidase regulatory-like domain-containing protein [Microscillaceae bacterium]|nr:STN and carboxypeptidase regulatory-like domain-containing protein [Microscillaceae bacterium]